MSPLKRQILIVTVIAAAVMELIDTSIVNVALNYMSGNLGATLEDISWVITMNTYTRYFQQKGISLLDAKIRALKLIDVIVVKQSALLSYEDAFFLVGIFFVITLPLLLFVVGQAKRKGGNVIISDH